MFEFIIKPKEARVIASKNNKERIDKLTKEALILIKEKINTSIEPVIYIDTTDIIGDVVDKIKDILQDKGYVVAKINNELEISYYE